MSWLLELMRMRWRCVMVWGDVIALSRRGRSRLSSGVTHLAKE